MLKKVISFTMVLVMCACALVGCGGKETADGITEITWHIVGVKKDASYDEVWNEVNKLLEERYHLRLKLVMTDGGNYGQKIQMMNVSQEPYDLCFTQANTNPFLTNVANESFLALNELLPKYAPKLYASISDAEKAAISVNDTIYAVPNYQMQGLQTAVSLVGDWVKEFGYKPEDFKSVADLEPFLKDLTAKYPECDKVSGSWDMSMASYGMICVAQTGLPGAIYFDKGDEKPVVFNQYESPEYMEYAKMYRRWVENGYKSSAYSTNNYNKKENLLSPGGPVNFMPGLNIQYEKLNGYEHTVVPLGKAVLSTSGITGALTAVGANSKHPEEAVKMLEVMHTDKEIFNMLVYGLEDINYEKVSDNVIRVKEGSSYSVSNWNLGSIMNLYVVDGYPETQWQDVKAFNDGAVVSPLNGFNVDTSNIIGALGNIETVLKEHRQNIEGGFVEPVAAIAELNAALKVAGVDDVIKEMQRQVDEWYQVNQ